MDLLYAIFVKKKPRLTPEENERLIDEYIKLFKESKFWSVEKWDQKLINFRKLAKKILLRKSKINNVSDDQLEHMVKTLFDLNNTKKLEGFKKIEFDKREQKRQDDRIVLSFNNYPKKSECFRVPENNENPLQFINSVKLNTDEKDALSSMVIFSSELRETILEQVGKGHNPVVIIENVKNVKEEYGKRVYGRIGDFKNDLSPQEILVSPSLFIGLGAKKESDVLMIESRLCLLMSPIQKIFFKFLGSKDTLNEVYSYIISRIEAKMTNDRMPGISRGSELLIWPNVSVRVEKILNFANEEIFAGGFPIAGTESTILYDIKAD